MEQQLAFSMSTAETTAEAVTAFSALAEECDLKLEDPQPLFKGMQPHLAAQQTSLQSTQTLTATEQGKEKEACAKLNQHPNIAYAEPNYVAKVCMVPDDPYYGSSGSWGQAYEDLWGLKKIQCEDAWDISQGNDVIVAVIDTGVDYDHPDLAANIWKNEAELNGTAGVDDDGNGYVDDIHGWDFAYYDNKPTDRYGHGTHCAGTIAAVGNNSTGVIGVAPQAKIMVIKGLRDNGNGYYSALANCVTYAADNGAHILSNSWGGYGSSQLLTDAFNYAYAKNCISIAAAGNSSLNVQYHTPSNIDSVIAVAASDHNDHWSIWWGSNSQSNYGDTIDVCAPGGGQTPKGGGLAAYDILSTVSATHRFNPDLVVSDGYARLGGTSMACPHVAGTAALMLANNPLLTNDEIRAMLQLSADDIGDPGKDKDYGYGRVNAYAACTSGRVSIAITKPLTDSYVHGDENGNVPISGDAYIEGGFNRYELYYALKSDPLTTTSITSSTVAKEDDVLGTWNTTGYADDVYILTLKLIDNEEKALFRSVEVRLDNVNDPPVFTYTDVAALIYKNLTFVVATDPDDPQTPEGSIRVSVAGDLPPGATLDAVTNTFSWQPAYADRGLYTVTFVAADSAHRVTQDVVISTLYLSMKALSDSDLYETSPGINGEFVVWNTHLGWLSQDPLVYGYAIDRYSIADQSITRLLEVGTPDQAYATHAYDDLLIWLRAKEGSSWRAWEMYKDGEVQPFPVSTAWVTAFDIYKDKIYWLNGGQNHIYDMSTDTDVTLPSTWGFKTSPRIHGDKIVYMELRNRGNRIQYPWPYDIYMYDLSNGTDTTIVEASNIQRHPYIHGDTVIWEDFRDEFPGPGIYMYDIATGETRKLMDNVGIAFSDATESLFEDKIVGVGRATTHGFSIYLYDIARSQQIELASCGGVMGPSIDRNRIVFATGGTYSSINMIELFYAPQILSATPTEVAVGSVITITGRDFGYEERNSNVTFANGVSAPIEAWSNTEITCTVPEGARSGLLRVVTEGGESNGIEITGLPVNQPPILDPIGNKTVNEMELLTFKVYAHDPDKEMIKLWADNLPKGAVFMQRVIYEYIPNGDRKVLGVEGFVSWTPTYDEAGEYKVTFTTADGEAKDSETIVITVNNVPRPPIIEYVYPSRGLVGQWVMIQGKYFCDGEDGQGRVVFHDGIPATTVPYWSDTQIACYVPEGAQKGDIHVITEAGTSNGVYFNVLYPPAAPTGLEAQAPLKNKVELTWTDNSNNETGFIIQRAQPIMPPPPPVPLATEAATEESFFPYFWFVEIGRVKADVTTFVDTTTLQKTRYHYRVLAYNEDGYSRPSNIADVTTPANKPPVLHRIGNKTVNEGEQLLFRVSATDPDDVKLKFKAAPLPEGARFVVPMPPPVPRPMEPVTDEEAEMQRDPLFVWNPDYTQAGTYEVTFSVTDGTEPATETITITVNNVTPAQLTGKLIDLVKRMNLKPGIERNLVSMLDTVIKSLEKGKDAAAIAKLNSFIQVVEAQSGINIPEKAAYMLTREARFIIWLIEEGI
jgi:beta propeller repeat protein